MMDICTLQSLFKNQIEDSSSSFAQAVRRYFDHQELPPFDAIEEGARWHEPLLSEEKAIENWKQLLAVNILCELTQSHQEGMGAYVRMFERHPWNQSSQYFRSLVALNHAFAKMPIPEVGPHLLESGAALIDLQEFSPWLSLPYTPHHFEFGIFLCLLALMTKRQDLQEIVLRMAKWQLNTLDVHGAPLAGFFVREKDSQSLHYQYLSYLLFRGAAILDEEQHAFSAVAQAVLKKLGDQSKQQSETIPPLWPLIESWMEQFHISAGQKLKLAEHLYDPSTALAGYRTHKQHVVCTLHGEHTGLGSMRYGDVEILSYGPQYLPLEECRGFGIEGNALSDHGMRRSVIEWRPQSFTLKGCTRLVDQPSTSVFGMGKFRGIWLEVAQEFKKPHFYLKTSLLGLDGWDSVAFSFFVKARRCQTHSDRILLPQTLERYEGEVQTIHFAGEEETLELRPLNFKGTMQILPLAGGANFWGADFLVAYHLSSDQKNYHWHMGPPNRV